MKFIRIFLPVAVTAALAGCSDTAHDKAAARPDKNWATVTTKYMDCEAASHQGCLVPVVDNTEGWGGRAHTLNVADSAKVSPYCHFGADSITSRCWPANGAKIEVHCKMPGSQVTGLPGRSSSTWYKVILPETYDGRRVWLQPKLGESMGDSAFGWVSALWLKPSREPVDCQE